MAQLARLDDPSESMRTAALAEIKRYGRFTKTVLQQVQTYATDQPIKTRVAQLLTEMARPAGPSVPRRCPL